MLDELQKLHAHILALLDQLERLTAEAAPPASLASLRFRLTCASRSRTRLLEGRIYALAAECASPGQLRMLQQLREEGKAQLSQSASHIATWDKRTIERRWPEYVRASRAMRASMRRRIKEEQEILYPLLEGVGKDASRSRCQA